MRINTASISSLCMLVLGSGCWLRSGSRLELEVVPAPQDLGKHAYEHVAKLVSFGERYPGSAGSAKAIDYIVAELEEMGLEPVRHKWIDKIEQIPLTNITATLPGESKNKIVIGCHHDTKRCNGHNDPAENFTFVGANDSGSGIGLVLELARELVKKKHRPTYEFVFFDGEESLSFDWDITRALFGSRYYVRRYQQAILDDDDAPIIEGFVLLDMVGAKDLQIDEDTNSDEEFRDLFYAAAEANGQQEFFFEYSSAVTDDHVPFIEAKIRAIDLIDVVDNPQWHTPDDVLEHVSADSLQIVGEVVLTALPGLEDLLFPIEIR